MKKKCYILITLCMLIISACSNDEGSDNVPLSQSKAPKKEVIRFYGTKRVKAQAQTKGITQINKLWRNTMAQWFSY